MQSAERERERERERGGGEREREREGGRESACVCACARAGTQGILEVFERSEQTSRAPNPEVKRHHLGEIPWGFETPEVLCHTPVSRTVHYSGWLLPDFSRHVRR
jgi:hypothetical protein